VDFILIALLVAMAAAGSRALLRWWRTRTFRARRASAKGYSPDHPLVLSSARVVDEAVSAARCECGGRVANRGETPRLGQRVVRGRCVDCDRDVDLYFVLPHLAN
jgi:hypothetical protein